MDNPNKCDYCGIFETTFLQIDSLFETDFEKIYYGGNENFKHYAGKYTITPQIGVSQELETFNKVLNKNLVVEEIPLSTVDNATGTSFIIG